MQHAQYRVDVKMLIDATGSMGGLIRKVQNAALRFHPDLMAALDAKGKVIDELRVGVTAFRDLNYDGKESLIDSGFFALPAQQDAFARFVEGLVASGGGDEPESGLEAIDLAIAADWTTEGTKRRHIIVVWSDASAHPIGLHGGDPNSGFRFAKSLDELTDRWHADGRLSKTSKRLILFTPDAAGWSEIATGWDNVVHFPSKAGDGLSEIDYRTILDAIQNSV
jgi:hypothetical protein